MIKLEIFIIKPKVFKSIFFKGNQMSKLVSILLAGVFATTLSASVFAADEATDAATAAPAAESAAKKPVKVMHKAHKKHMHKKAAAAAAPAADATAK
jgi:uncharacterized protein (UPF0333 family)